MGTVVTVLLMIICAAAQSTWPMSLRLGGQAPDLVLAIAICLGLRAGAFSGFTAGFIGAYLWGAVSSAGLGHLFVSHMGLGFLAGALRGRVFADRILIAMLLVAIGGGLSALVELVMAPPASPKAWFVQVLVRTLYSALIALPLYLLVQALGRYYPEPENL
jgi:hypothetical protein